MWCGLVESRVFLEDDDTAESDLTGRYRSRNSSGITKGSKLFARWMYRVIPLLNSDSTISRSGGQEMISSIEGIVCLRVCTIVWFFKWMHTKSHSCEVRSETCLRKALSRVCSLPDWT